MPAPRVLLVDDESVILQSLEFLLELLGFTIAGTAADFSGALKLASTAEADVAILDIDLNGTFVFPAADALVARNIPVIFTSGRMTNLPARFASTTFVGKPYLPEILIDHIERLTSQAQQMRQACHRNDGRSGAEAASSPTS
jgi:DNA-binding NtrC family response regulator